MLQITATEKGYTIVDAEKSITHIVRSEHSICTLTNMQRAMLYAAQIMEEKEKEKESERAAPTTP